MGPACSRQPRPPACRPAAEPAEPGCPIHGFQDSRARAGGVDISSHHLAGATMREQIHGTTMPVLSVHLDPGESVVAEVGEFSWMTDSIQISTGMGTGMGGRSLVSALDRVAGGRTAPMSTYTAQGGPGTITFAPKVPGSILLVDVC